MEGTRELEGARLLEGVTLLGGVGLLNGSKYLVRKKLTRISCIVMMTHQAAYYNKKVIRKRTCSNCPYVWHDEPNQIKIAMILDKPRPAKIYFIQLSAQQRH